MKNYTAHLPSFLVGMEKKYKSKILFGSHHKKHSWKGKKREIENFYMIYHKKYTHTHTHIYIYIYIYIYRYIYIYKINYFEIYTFSNFLAIFGS